jgi:hypothetical protein
MHSSQKQYGVGVAEAMWKQRRAFTRQRFLTSAQCFYFGRHQWLEAPRRPGPTATSPNPALVAQLLHPTLSGHGYCILTDRWHVHDINRTELVYCCITTAWCQRYVLATVHFPSSSSPGLPSHICLYCTSAVYCTAQNTNQK